MNSTQQSSDTSAIALVNKEFGDAMRAGSASRLASIYSSEGQLLPPNNPIVSGAEGIESYWQGAIDMGITDANLKTEELDFQGNTVIEVGSFILKQGENVADIGKYIVIWKNENGEWKYHHDIWNSDNAA